MRLFIAILLTEEMKNSLVDVQRRMYEDGVRGNYSPEENLHLTLAFIGEYPKPDDVMDALNTVSFSPFEFSFEGVGNFGDLWWAGIRDNPALQAVVRRIRRALSDAQIQFDRKTFRPHITLLRRARAEYGMPDIKVQNKKMKAEAVSLMKSERGKNGMIYTEIGRIRGVSN